MGINYTNLLPSYVTDEDYKHPKPKEIIASENRSKEIIASENRSKELDRYYKNREDIEFRNKGRFWSMRSRAIKKGIPFELEYGDIDYPELCPILEIPIDYIHGSRHHNSPHYDRIDNKKGYIKGNVRVISGQANIMKSYASNEELLVFAKNIKSYLEI